MKETKLDPSKIDDICVGVLFSQVQAYTTLLTSRVGTCHPPSPLYISRAAALAAGIPHHVPVSVVNRLCSSGLMAIRNIAHAIQSGETLIGIAAGAESMSMK